MLSRMKKVISNISRTVRAKDVVAIERELPNKNLLAGKVVLISGGSGGIGMAAASLLHESGASIVLAGTNEGKLRKCAEKIGGSRVRAVVINYSDPNEIKSAVNNAIEQYGRIDVYIHAAGVHTENVDPWAMTPSEYERVMRVNLEGAYFSTQAIAKHMIHNGIKGHILLVNSSRGFEPAWSPYGISKWGLRGMTEGFAQLLLPHGIIVNGIAPGSTATTLIGVSEGDSIDTLDNGVGRMATPYEIATWIKMLVAGTGDMVVGETILVSGGRGSIDIR